MTFLTSTNFWISTAERAIKTVAQSAAAVLGAGYTGLLEVDPIATVSIAGLAGVISVLTSIASGRVGDPDSPSLTHE